MSLVSEDCWLALVTFEANQGVTLNVPRNTVIGDLSVISNYYKLLALQVACKISFWYIEDYRYYETNVSFLNYSLKT